MYRGLYRYIAFFLIIITLIITPPIGNSIITDKDFPEARCYVNEVIDGDTFRCAPSITNGTHTEAKIRLADVNAPEIDTPEGKVAKRALASLILGRIVYLDIDDKHGTDVYGRWVAVAYIRYNDTHILNVNKWLVDNGYAEIIDYDNEFDPANFSLYEQYESFRDRYPEIKAFTISPSPYYPEYGVRGGVIDGYGFYTYSFGSNYYIKYIVFSGGNITENQTLNYASYSTAPFQVDVYHGMVSAYPYYSDYSHNRAVVIVWTQYKYSGGSTTYYKTVFYGTVPMNGNITSFKAKPVQLGSYQFSPLVAALPPSDQAIYGGRFIITFTHSTSDNVKLYIYEKDGVGNTLDSTSLNLTPVGVTYQDKPDVGVDYRSGIYYDEDLDQFYLLVRTLNSSTGYDMMLVVIQHYPDNSIRAELVPVNNAPGDQGPRSEATATGTRLYILSKNIASAYCPSSKTFYAVYNVSSDTLEITIINTSTLSVVARHDITVGSVDDMYPRIACMNSEALLTYYNGYGVYGVIVYKNHSISNPFEIVYKNTYPAVPLYNPENGNYTVVMNPVASAGEGTGYIGVISAPVNSSGYIDRYTMPILVSNNTNYTNPYPLIHINNTKYYLSILAIDQNKNTILALQSPVYIEPTPIPENRYMWLIVLLTASTILFLLFRNRTRHN